MPELLEKLDVEVPPQRQSKIRLDKTVGFTDSLLRYRVFQRYGKCLLRTLTLFKFLRRQGWHVEIHFGVRRNGDDKTDITGHSWLVLSGEPFLEDVAQSGDYFETYRFP